MINEKNVSITSELVTSINNDNNLNNMLVNNNTLSDKQIKLLESYKDKSFIVSILAKSSHDYYSTIKSFVNIPLILSSTTLAILNSASLNGEQMRIPNIVINSITGLTLAMISNFKITEKVTVFNNVFKKMNKLNHRIEEALINNTTDLNIDKISKFINEYEALIETLDYQFPVNIKKKIYNKYKDTGLKLPNALIGFEDITLTDLNINNI